MFSDDDVESEFHLPLWFQQQACLIFSLNYLPLATNTFNLLSQVMAHKSVNKA
jgi:hypothetical protein